MTYPSIFYACNFSGVFSFCNRILVWEILLIRLETMIWDLEFGVLFELWSLEFQWNLPPILGFGILYVCSKSLGFGASVEIEANPTFSSIAISMVQ